MKTCSICGEEKPLCEFNKHIRTKDGLTASCRSCNQKRSRKYYQENKGKVAEINNRWKINNPEKVAEIKKKWLVSNPEKRRESVHKSYEKHKEEKLAYSKKWRMENNDKRIFYEKSRRARIYGAEINDFNKRQWEEVLSEHGNFCHYCGRDDVRMTMDHVIPLSKGGNHTKSNIVPACLSCNSKKNNRLDFIGAINGQTTCFNCNPIME